MANPLRKSITQNEQRFSHPWLSCLSVLACWMATAVHAQPPAPDAGSILRDTERSISAPAPALSPRAIPEAPLEVAPDEVTFLVERFDVRGVTLISMDAVQAALQPWLNRPLTFAELEQALSAISEVYQQYGWYARPQLPEQDIIDNTIIVNVIEGRMGEVLFPDEEEGLPIASKHLNRYLTVRQQPGDYLNMDNLDRSIRILNELPGITTQVALAASESPGASDLVVWSNTAKPLNASLMLDNSGSRATGRERAYLSGNWNNPIALGDQANLALLAADGMSYGRFGYTMPVGYQGLKFNAALSALRYRIIQREFRSTKSRGEAHTMSVGATYPWLRSATQNRDLRLTLEQADYDNEANRATVSKKRLVNMVLGVSGDLADSAFGGGFNLWGLELTRGDLSIKDSASKAADALGPRAAGNFTKLSGNVARLQRLTDTTTLWASFNGQVSNTNLDSSQQFSLGGTNGVRAYPTSEGVGDYGWLATLELRHTVSPQWQLTAFYDHGWVRQNHDARYVDASNTSPSQYALRGAGIAANYTISGNVNLRATWAHRLGSNPNRTLEGKDSDGTNDHSRIWLQLVVSL